MGGVAGYGKRSLSLTPARLSRARFSTPMAAAGMRGELMSSARGGFGLAVKADALWVTTSSGGERGSRAGT